MGLQLCQNIEWGEKKSFAFSLHSWAFHFWYHNCLPCSGLTCLIITRHWQNQEFTAQECYVTWAQLHKNGIRKYPGKTLTFILTSRLYNVHHSDVCTSKKESSGNKINLSLAAMILIQNNLEIIGQQWTDHLVISVCMIKAEFLKKLLLFILFYS